MTNEKNEVDRRAAPSSSADELPPKMAWLDAPEDTPGDHARAWAKGWNDCRAAIQAAAPADCACDSPKWCTQYSRCHRIVCGFAPAEDAQTEQPSAFVQHLQQSAKLVEGWPEWKRAPRNRNR